MMGVFIGFSLVGWVVERGVTACKSSSPIETARLRGIGGGRSARLSAAFEVLRGQPAALAFASDWFLKL